MPRSGHCPVLIPRSGHRKVPRSGHKNMPRDHKKVPWPGHKNLPRGHKKVPRPEHLTGAPLTPSDNKNLTFLNTATLLNKNLTSSRVYRWKLAIQRYAFNIRHVVGELNVVADAFSICVFDNYSTKAYPIQAVATMNEIVLTDEQYNTIGQFHNSTAGHAGIDRTVKRMHKAGISWPYLRELVRAYICMGPVCQKMS